MPHVTMPTLMTPVRRPNQGGSITKDGVQTKYAPSAADSGVPQHSATQNSGGTITANVSPGVKLTRSFDPSGIAGGGSSVRPASGQQPRVLQPSGPQPGASARPNLGGTMSTNIAPGVDMTRRIAPSPAGGMTQRNPGMNSGGSISADLSPGVKMTRNFSATPAAPAPALQRSPGGVNGQAAAPQQTEQVNPMTGDGGSGGPVEDGSQSIGEVSNVPNLFSARGTAAPQGADALPGQHTGGSGLYAKKFSNPRSASVYDGYVRGLFA